MRYIIALILLALPLTAASAQTVCICASAAGCKVVTDSYPPGASQPTSCNVYKSGAFLVAGTMVDSATIATSNAASCMPASAAYVPGIAGSMACVATIPQQTAGSLVSLTGRGVNAAGEAPDGATFSFQSVLVLPTLPPARGIRVTP